MPRRLGGGHLRRLREIQEGDWLVWRNSLYQLKDHSACPVCGTRFQCWEHQYTYRRWFVGLQRGVDVQDDDSMAVFPTRQDAEAYREWLLQHPQ